MKMDDKSSEEDLYFFVVLDIASVMQADVGQGPLSGAPLAMVRGKKRRVGVSKWRVDNANPSKHGRGGIHKQRRMGLGGPASRVSLRKVLGMVPSHINEVEMVELTMVLRHAVLTGQLSGVRDFACDEESELRSLFDGKEL